MKNVLVSIIIPIHHFEKYFYKCLDCLFSQTEHDIEIIIVDDHSKDDIKSSIKQYFKDSRCHYVRLDSPLGPGGARNIGMAVANGKYIGFCDSDDWVDLDYYRKASELMSETQADIAMCGQIREYDFPSKQKLYKCKYDRFIEMNGETAFQIMTHNYYVDIKVLPQCTNKIYRRSFLQNCGLQFQEKVFFQDIIFSVEALLKADKVICVPNVLYHYYRRQNSIIQSFDDKHIHDFENLGLSIRNYLEKNNLYKKYKRNYYSLMAHFYEIIIQEIFEFIIDDELRKKAIVKTFSALKSVIRYEEYIDYITAEQLRSHLFPQLNDTMFI